MEDINMEDINTQIINEGNVTSPKGFLATGAHVGLKKAKKDLALLISQTPARVAGCFTTNIVKTAPVLWDSKIVAGGKPVRGVIVNSGNANACTGQQGEDDAKAMAEGVAALLGAQPQEVLVCSTGVIGVPLPMQVIQTGIASIFPTLRADAEGGRLAAEAIMTTDTFPKHIAVRVILGGKEVTIGGMAKGSGMIHPNMATLLSFVTTDAAISQPLLQKALAETVTVTYNMISVDGDTSTNDTILALANGQAGNPEILGEDADYQAFKEALLAVNRYLAVSIARDGEGATKLIEVRVTGACAEEDARKIARSVTASSLFKAMLFGSDANFGRVLCAMGYSGGQFDPQAVSISFASVQGEIPMMEAGKPIPFDEARAKKILLERDIVVNINLRQGTAEATAWGCDLSYDYVKINGDYRS